MSAAELSPLNDNEDEEDRQRVFVRVISTRPGAPWDQSRQASLEARLGAPARLTEVVYRVRRLEPWRPSRPARFAAVYARAEDARQGLRAAPTIDGRPIPISFAAPAAQARQLRDLGLVGLAWVAAIGLGLLLIMTVASRRSKLEGVLAQTETMASARLNRAERLDRMEGQANILDGLRLKDQRLSVVLSQIARVSAAKTPNAHIQALHWDHGFLALEADGDRPPIQDSDHQMQRSGAPIRPGVWLWGLSSTEPWGPGQSAGIDASSKPGRRP